MTCLQLDMEAVNIFCIWSCWSSYASTITKFLGIYQFALLGLWWSTLLDYCNSFLYFCYLLSIDFHDYVLIICSLAVIILIAYSLFVFMFHIFVTVWYIFFFSLVIIISVTIAIFLIYVMFIFCLIYILIWLVVCLCHILDIILIINRSTWYPLKIGHPLVIAGWSSSSYNSSIWSMA